MKVSVQMELLFVLTENDARECVKGTSPAELPGGGEKELGRSLLDDRKPMTREFSLCCLSVSLEAMAQGPCECDSHISFPWVERGFIVVCKGSSEN